MPGDGDWAVPPANLTLPPFASDADPRIVLVGDPATLPAGLVSYYAGGPWDGNPETIIDGFLLYGVDGVPFEWDLLVLNETGWGDGPIRVFGRYDPFSINTYSELFRLIGDTVDFGADTIVRIRGELIFDDFATASDVQSASGTTTSTSFTATLTGGTACGFAFTAPDSGRITVINTAQMFNSGANSTRCSFTIRTGSTVGSGSVVLAASDNRSCMMQGTSEVGFSRGHPVTGLTPGSAYNIQQEFRVGAGTGTFSQKNVIVTPEM